MKWLLILLLLTGCTSYQVPNWPEMKVYEHYLPHAEMRDICSKYAPWWGPAEACAEWNLETKECHIYYSKDFPPQQWIIDHERAHCKGWMHD